MLQIILLSLSSWLAPTEGTTVHYSANTEESSVEWFAEKVTGKHHGAVELKEGKFTFEDGQLTGGFFTVDMTTIKDTDMDDGQWKTKLEAHLKSDDFFGVETYPTSKFEITRVVPQGPGRYKVIGNMTIKDKTQEIQFPAIVEEKDGKLLGTATLTLDRSKYNVRYGSGTFFDDLGDKTIYDNFDLKISIVASK